MENNARRDGWHNDYKTIVALIAALIIQAASIIWWASGIEHRMLTVEAERVANHTIIERVVRMETMLSSVDRRLNELGTNVNLILRRPLLDRGGDDRRLR